MTAILRAHGTHQLSPGLNRALGRENVVVDFMCIHKFYLNISQLYSTVFSLASPKQIFPLKNKYQL